MADTTASTTKNDLPADLVQLAAAIQELPPEHAASLAPLLDQVIESTGRRRRILKLVQDALGQLRLDMKYLMFDLEATRRERDEAQSRLEGYANDSDGLGADEFDGEQDL